MKHIHLYILIILLAIISCTENDEVQSTPALVVEGWIDHEGYPIVLVTTTIDVTEKATDLSALKDHIVRWATVTVDDGEHSVVLTGKVDRRYFPPYIYTTSAMKGKAGKSYHLTVDYDTYHAEATTTIPHPVPLDSVRVFRCKEPDTLYQVKAWFKDNPTEHNRYKFFTCVGTDKRMYLSSYMQTIDDAMLSPGEEICVSVFKGRLVTERTRYVPYFTRKDTISVKFAQMDSTSFTFWNQMEHKMTLGNSPLSASRYNPSFNLHGALGYWCGYGAVTWPIILSDSIDVPSL